MLRADEFKQGASLGRYEIIKKLALGGMAEIYLARVRGTAGFEKLVVLKRILPSVAEDASFVQMFLDEARLAATLRHPNIADVFDVGAEDNSYYFAMEFIHGQDARTIRIAAYELDRDIPIEIALAIASGTAYALAYAHAKTGPQGPLGIVHRDITPSNILVSYDGAVKLVDFGIARADSRTNSAKTRTGTLKGKVPYMSPEQCKGKKLDRRSDLFSLGTVLYELTTGQRPFDGHSEYDTLEMIVHGRLQPPSTLVPTYPAELERIVMKLLALDPAARYQDADTVLVDLEKLTSEAGLLVSERAVAKYMREVFAEEIAEWENASIAPTTQTTVPTDFSELATGSGELDPFSSAAPRAAAAPTTPYGARVVRSGLSLELDESTTPPPPAHPVDATREDPPDAVPRLLTSDPPTLQVRIDETTDEPLHGLLVTPEVQVFVRTTRSTSPPPVGPDNPGRSRKPTASPRAPSPSAFPAREASGTQSAAHRAATLSAPTITRPRTGNTQSVTPRAPSPAPRPRDFTEKVATTKATQNDLREAIAAARTASTADDDLAIISEVPPFDPDLTARDDARPRAATTSPDRTRLDTVLRFDPITARGDDLLDEVDTDAPPNETETDRALRRIALLCARCTSWLASGDFDQAVVAAELALEEPAADERVQRLLARERKTLLAAFASYLGEPSRPVHLARPLDELVGKKLDQQAAFLLSRIDGQATVEELLDMSGLPRFEASRALCRLVLRKMILVG